MSLQEQLAALVSDRLPEMVEAALGEQGAVLGDWEATSLKGGCRVLSLPRSLIFLHSVAHMGEAERPYLLAWADEARRLLVAL